MTRIHPSGELEAAFGRPLLRGTISDAVRWQVIGSGSTLVGQQTSTFIDPSRLAGETEQLTAEDLLYENLVLRLHNAQLVREFGDLEEELGELRSRVDRLEATAPEVKTIVLREITREEAKSEIKQLFSSGEAFDYEAIVERLNLDLELVVDVCRELMDEGEIGPDAGLHERG